MNWEAVQAVAELIGSIAVVATIVYLAGQIHQNTRHTKALLQQGQVGRVADILLQMSDAQKAKVWIQGNGGDATPESIQELQFAQLCNLIVYDMMDFHNTNGDGLNSSEQFGSACVGYANLLRQPGFKSYWDDWKTQRSSECPQFIAWVDSLAPDDSTGEISRWT